MSLPTIVLGRTYEMSYLLTVVRKRLEVFTKYLTFFWKKRSEVPSDKQSVARETLSFPQCGHLRPRVFFCVCGVKADRSTIFSDGVDQKANRATSYEAMAFIELDRIITEL